MHQEADRHADLDDDQGNGKIGSGQGARDQQPGAQGRPEQRSVCSGVWFEHLKEPDGGTWPSFASSKTAVWGSDKAAGTSEPGSVGHEGQAVLLRGGHQGVGHRLLRPQQVWIVIAICFVRSFDLFDWVLIFVSLQDGEGGRPEELHTAASEDLERHGDADHWPALLLQVCRWTGPGETDFNFNISRFCSLLFLSHHEYDSLTAIFEIPIKYGQFSSAHPGGADVPLLEEQFPGIAACCRCSARQDTCLR